MNNPQPDISVSIVSHGQGRLVAALLSDIAAHCKGPLEVILTVNIPESLPFETGAYPFPVRVICNASRKGFGANHNEAFRHASGKHFCVLNPDIRFDSDPFPGLIAVLAGSSIGVAAPLILNPRGGIEDSARRFPTPGRILRKLLAGSPGPDYLCEGDVVHPDWVAGMFMVFRTEVYGALSGFDERYFLYYEDVDLCWRLRRQRLEAVLLPGVRAIHDARRTSHRSLRYLSWHSASMLRFFLKRLAADVRGRQ